jgi:hypothetical protein
LSKRKGVVTRLPLPALRNSVEPAVRSGAMGSQPPRRKFARRTVSSSVLNGENSHPPWDFRLSIWLTF